MPDTPRDLAKRVKELRYRRTVDDGYLRETHTLPRVEARDKAKAFLKKYPKAAYMSAVDSWQELPGDRIEFTMRRLRTAD